MAMNESQQRSLGTHTCRYGALPKPSDARLTGLPPQWCRTPAGGCHKGKQKYDSAKAKKLSNKLQTGAFAVELLQLNDALPSCRSQRFIEQNFMAWLALTIIQQADVLLVLTDLLIISVACQRFSSPVKAST